MRRDALHANVVLRRIIFPNYVSCVVSGDKFEPTLPPPPPKGRTRCGIAFFGGLIVGVFSVGFLWLFKRYGGNIN